MFIFYLVMQDFSNVSFKSRINIVGMKAFDKIPKGKYIHYFSDASNANILKSDTFSTVNVRTCTGGGLSSKNELTALGFHLWDCEESSLFKKYVDFIKDSFPQVDSALIVGSKKTEFAKKSVKNFLCMKKMLQKKCSNLSWFQTITKQGGEVDFKYSKADDTWTLRLLEWRSNQEKPDVVNSLKKLLDFFEEISISPNDRLFISGKEVTEKQAPQIFRKR